MGVQFQFVDTRIKNEVDLTQDVGEIIKEEVEPTQDVDEAVQDMDDPLLLPLPLPGGESTGIGRMVIAPYGDFARETEEEGGEGTTQPLKRKIFRTPDPMNRLDVSLNHMLVRMRGARKRCRVCYRRDQLRKDTHYQCSTCLIPLCVGQCDHDYHRMAEYWH